MKQFLAALASALFITSAATAGDLPIDKLQSLNNPSYHRVDSAILERPFHLFVRLPDSYDHTDQTYPVVYLLDGGATFPMLASYARYLLANEEIPEMIIVGVSYGNNDWGVGNFRSTDFTAPAASREEYGGAENFQRVFREEFMPLIEGAYRTETGRRIIFGQSLGGQFVLYSALTEPDLFWGHIASNPALHRNLDLFVGFDFEEEDKSASRVFASSGSEDDPRFREPALTWFEHWSPDDQQKPWALKTVTLEGESHFSAAPAAFRNGTRWLFSGEE